MIPADTLARLKLTDALLTQPAQGGQKLSDALQEFAPGQRLAAVIQTLLPNGLYRASVAQRDLTLSLPFPARPGDTLELEVVEQNGKLTLAVATSKEGAQAAEEGGKNASVATRLTIAGRLIGELLGALDKEGGKRPQPAPLNNAQPVVTRFPDNAADLAPALKAALAKSGMFYEAHQAQWVAGKTPLTTLLAEPQGRLSPGGAGAQQIGAGAPQTGVQQGAGVPQGTGVQQSAGAQQTGVGTTAQGGSAANAGAGAAGAGASPQAASSASGAANSAAAANAAASRVEGELVLRVGMGQVIARELAPLVQQQLEALATNAYVWQGQVWPGQNMDWEIIEEEDRRERGENTAANWTTRLALTLPRLGGVEATLRLVGGKEIEIRHKAENDAARARLSAAGVLLQQQFATAGLKLSAFAVSHPRDSHAKAAAPAP
ncbi:MAG: flagellar hook-length control protein FliK [Zoogloeaceae bacterium]|jgi:hypothetical protein|nr:flagellar hook-length control protein FliK [Zoogloeaceae bacterium]